MVLQVIRRVEGLGHKIFLDNDFTSPALMTRSNEKSVHVEQFVMTGVECRDFGPKSLKMKRGNIVT
jgi:hypothetical protein